MADTLSAVLAGSPVAEPLRVLAKTSAKVAGLIARSPLTGGAEVVAGDANASGDSTKALDLRAQDLYVAALRGSGISGIGSEEADITLYLPSLKYLKGYLYTLKKNF